ncbi:hypothetical protein HaLaN_12061 [Haematococcus lacustris]|uniref:Secreted protein n=1 Tax=Haematococcus lacustris TaxID=44745 RepID=A0A699Z950_HAELA|nr:hypothetical protein HaLaN_12061 [Haematococcus lacustris]
MEALPVTATCCRTAGVWLFLRPLTCNVWLGVTGVRGGCGVSGHGTTPGWAQLAGCNSASLLTRPLVRLTPGCGAAGSGGAVPSLTGSMLSFRAFGHSLRAGAWLQPPMWLLLSSL